VTHLNELILILQTDTDTITVGTTSDLSKQLNGESGRAGSIDVSHLDENMDGRPEAILVNIDVPSSLDPTFIRSVVVI
jgi:hypothetical protein